MTLPLEQQSRPSAWTLGPERNDPSSQLPGLSWTTGPNGLVETVGGRWHDWTGQPPAEALGLGWIDGLHPDDAPRIQSHWQAAIASETPFSARFRVGPGRDGHIRPVIARAEPVLNEDGRPIAWNGLAMLDPDPTEPPTPEPWRSAAATPTDDDARAEDFAIFWIASVKERRLTSVSPSSERLLGRSVAELTGQARSWLDLAHPDDRSRVADGYARRASGPPETLVYRLLRSDGSSLLVRDRVLTALTRSMGDPDRVFGVLEAVESDQGASTDRPQEVSKTTSTPTQATNEPSNLAELIDRLGDLCLIVDQNGRCVSINAPAEALLGQPCETLRGQPLVTLIPELADAPAEAALRRAQDDRQSVRFEVASARSDRWLEVRAAPVAQGLGLIVRDVTEAQARLLELQEIEELYQLSSEAVDGLIYDWRVETGHVQRSSGLLTLLGIAPGEAEPTNLWWRNRIHPDDRPQVLADLEQLKADPRRRHYSLEYRVQHRDGHYLDVWDKGVCLRDDQGRLARVVGSTIDISDRRRSEQALREADRMKTEFLAVLAHELRNPLCPILAAAQALNTDLTNPNRNLSAIIERQARHMARLIEDLLDISRISHGKVLVRPEPLNLVELVSQTLDTVEGPFREQRLELRVDLPETPLPIEADPTRLAQCVSNLLHNASKFTEPGGSVTVRVGSDDTSAFVEVADTGIGIAPDVLPTLFLAYWQADTSRKQSQGGLGLGLALVKNLMELQGGRVEAASAGEGQGSTFRLVLPLRHAADPGPEESSAMAATTPNPSSTSLPPGLRLLVVDDRRDMAHLLSRLLGNQGHHVSVANDAEQALEIARRERPEVILSDIGLPGSIDGYGLARALRADPTTSSALLIAMTGYARADDRDRALQSGFDDHLTKPLDFGTLCERLGKLAPGPRPSKARA
ncbi:PAS domain-containing protein [Tautonia marina]|uniref:PAS domain-containing protein n=1 Tax=Tautonia marina TaxID=2653855 RepID=UPI0013756BC0|nr:PAS domain-containing protein [Tautonia marina]